MAEKNEHYQIEITDISSDGNGVGTVDGMTVSRVCLQKFNNKKFIPKKIAYFRDFF